MLEEKQKKTLQANYDTSMLIWSNIANAYLSNGQKPPDPPPAPDILEDRQDDEDDLMNCITPL